MINWQEQEVPDFEGIYKSEVESYLYKDGEFSITNNPQYESDQDIAVLCSFEVPNSHLVIYDCEAFGHGSIGVVLLEDKQSGKATWSMLSSRSKPFSQISVSKQQYSILSTSGSTFSFELPLNKPKLTIKN